MAERSTVHWACMKVNAASLQIAPKSPR
jgi:hypothetical protein